MNLFPITPTVALVMQLMDTKVSTVPAFEETSFKPEYDFEIHSTRLERCAPEEEGVPSALVSELLETLRRDKTLNMHSITIARNGRILCEASFGAQKLNIWKHAFSACKSVTSLAVGMLIDDGVLALDERVVDIFKDKSNGVAKVKLKDLCVEDLLTMRSSVLFSEVDAMTDSDWIKAFLGAPTKGVIGKSFRYNSLNTYMLSAIVTAKTGKLLSDFLDERLFAPLGIKDYYWEKCPQGIDKGGWGLYIRPEDFVKIGTLVANGGEYGTQRIVSEEYINLATAKHVEVERESDCFDYGYQIWVGKNANTFLFNGMLGQNVLCFKDSGIVVVSNAGNSDMFQQGNFFDYLDKFFNRDFEKKLPSNDTSYKKLKKQITALSLYSGGNVRKSLFKRWAFAVLKRNKFAIKSLVGKKFEVEEGDCLSVGILPLVVQAAGNCYSKGFTGLEFSVDGNGKPVLVYKENGSEINIPLTFDNPAIWNMKYRNQNFIISSKAKFTQNEDDIDVLVVRLDFAETPSSRLIKLFFTDDGIVMEQSEEPGEDFLIELSETAISEYAEKPIIGTVLEKFGADYIEYRIGKIFNSRLTLISK